MVYCSKCGTPNAEGARYCNNCAASLALSDTAAPWSSLQQPGPSQQQSQAPAPIPPQLQPGQKATLLDYLSHYQGLQYHWVRRFVALLFDGIFVLLPVYVTLALLSWMFGGFLGFLGIGGIVLFLYSAFFEYSMGGTIGKLIMGLRVVSTKGKLELTDTLVRNITKIYSLLLLIEFIVTLVVETTDAHQRYLDKLAKTTVIEKR
jgi:uncharacterized RDD family membrane protein YckC